MDNVVKTIQDLDASLESAQEILEMAEADEDQEMVEDVVSELERLESMLDALEFQRMFSGELDANNCYLEIQAGSGGTEAQDWANILLRMYLRWAESHNFKAEIVEISAGEVAGIKGATVHVQGDYAYGWLRTETVCIVWCVSLLLIPVTAVIRLLHQYSFLQKLMIVLRLKSIRQI